MCEGTFYNKIETSKWIYSGFLAKNSVSSVISKQITWTPKNNSNNLQQQKQLYLGTENWSAKQAVFLGSHYHIDHEEDHCCAWPSAAVQWHILDIDCTRYSRPTTLLQCDENQKYLFIHAYKKYNLWSEYTMILENNSIAIFVKEEL